MKVLKVTATFTKEYEVLVPEDLYELAYGKGLDEGVMTNAALEATMTVDHMVVRPAHMIADEQGMNFMTLEWEKNKT